MAFRFRSPVNALSIQSKFVSEAASEHGFNSFCFKETADLESLPPGDYPKRYLYDKEKLGPRWRYYHSEKLTYEENSLGHRSHLELENLKGDWGLAVGCSQTEGIASYYEDVYHQKLATKIGIPFYNAGVGGGSNDLAFHNALMIISFMKNNPPKFLIFQITDSSRFLYAHKDKGQGIATAGSWSKDKPQQDVMLADEMMKLPSTRLNMILLQLSSLCNSLGIKFIPLDYFIAFNISRNALLEMYDYNHLGIAKEDYFLLPESYFIEKNQMKERIMTAEKSFTSNVDRVNYLKARDLSHAGAGTHEEISVFLANVINSMEYP
jgi:hypothetical protein